MSSDSNMPDIEISSSYTEEDDKMVSEVEDTKLQEKKFDESVKEETLNKDDINLSAEGTEEVLLKDTEKKLNSSFEKKPLLPGNEQFGKVITEKGEPKHVIPDDEKINFEDIKADLEKVKGHPKASQVTITLSSTKKNKSDIDSDSVSTSSDAGSDSESLSSDEVDEIGNAKIDLRTDLFKDYSEINKENSENSKVNDKLKSKDMNWKGNLVNIKSLEKESAKRKRDQIADQLYEFVDVSPESDLKPNKRSKLNRLNLKLFIPKTPYFENIAFKTPEISRISPQSTSNTPKKTAVVTPQGTSKRFLEDTSVVKIQNSSKDGSKMSTENADVVKPRIVLANIRQNVTPSQTIPLLTPLKPSSDVTIVPVTSSVPPAKSLVPNAPNVESNNQVVPIITCNDITVIPIASSADVLSVAPMSSSVTIVPVPPVITSAGTSETTVLATLVEDLTSKQVTKPMKPKPTATITSSQSPHIVQSLETTQTSNLEQSEYLETSQDLDSTDGGLEISQGLEIHQEGVVVEPNRDQIELSHSVESSQLLIQCKNCVYQAASAEDMQLHVSSTHYGELAKDADFMGKYLPFVDISSQVQLVQTFSCKVCPYQSSSKYRLRSHLLCHDNNAPRFQCKNCSFNTKYKSSLVTHQRIHARDCPQLELQCPSCGLKQPHDVQKYYCALCPFETIYKNSLNIHKQRHVNQEILLIE